MPAPLNYTWTRSRWTSLSKFTTIGGQQVADHVRTPLQNDFRSREREAVPVKVEKLESQDTGDLDPEVHGPKKRKTTRGLLEELVSSARSEERAQQSPEPAKGVVSAEIKALNTPRRSVRSTKSTELP